MTLVDVTWAGLPLNVVDDNSGLGKVVTELEGWYATPEPDPHDVERALADGGLYGPMVLKPRELTLSGTVYGSRADVLAVRDALAQRAVSRDPAPVTVGDPWTGQQLTVSARASSALSHQWIGNDTFRWQITLRAADPRRYAATWQSATITLAGMPGDGRRYPRHYGWNYGSGIVPGTAQLSNQGNTPAPVIATYLGPLSESRLTDGTNTIHVADLGAGEVLYVATDSLVAQAPGGATRANYILAGSGPLLVPAQSTVTWRLIGSGSGTVTLQWRSAWN